MQFAFTFSAASCLLFLHSSRVFNLFYFPLCLVLMLSLALHLFSLSHIFPRTFFRFFFRAEGFVKRQFVMQFMCIQMRYIWAKLFISNSFRWGYSNSPRVRERERQLHSFPQPESFSLVQLSHEVYVYSRKFIYICIYVYVGIQLSGCEISINCWPDKHYGAFINLHRLCIKCALKSLNMCM